MGLTNIAILLGLVALSACSMRDYKGTNDHLFPMNSESTYRWRALVRAGTHLPNSVASVMTLNGKLRIQSMPNATHMQLSDLTFTMYNGDLTRKEELKAKEIPMKEVMGDKMKNMENGFIVMRDNEGLATGIITEADELEFSKNMKKSIASIMQLNTNALKMKERLPYSFGFSIDEMSLYGRGNMDYMMANNGEMLEIRKVHTMNSSEHLYTLMVNNIAEDNCDLPYEEPIMHDSLRKYTMMVSEDKKNLVAKQIMAAGGVFYYPMQAKSDAQYIFINQTFDLINMVPSIEKMIEVKSPHEEHHLTFHAIDESMDMPDVTGGRRDPMDTKKMMPMIEKMMTEIWDYFNHDHLHTKSPDTKKGQVVNKAIRLLTFLKMEQLEELHNNLKQKTTHERDVFYRLLPMVGSRASTIMIKNLIMQKMVKDHVAVEMLQHMHENMYLPKIELLQKLEVFLDMPKDMNEHVRRLAALAFGNIMFKSAELTDTIMKKNDMFMHKMEDRQKMEQLFEKYVMMMLKKMRESTSLEDKLTCMHVLYNMKMPSIAEHLRPILTRQEPESKHVRALAMWAVAASIAYNDMEEKMEMFWSILADRDEDSDIRFTAYYTIMESRPNLSELTNLFFYMMMEPDRELYRAHWTYATSMMQSKEPCNEEFRMRMRQMMKFMQPPNFGVSTFTIEDFRDSKFGFGGGYISSFFQTNDTQLISFVTTSQTFNVMSQDYSLFIKIHGVPKHITNKMALMSALTSSNILNDNAHMEIIIMKQDAIVNTYFLTEKNYMKEFEMLKKMFSKDGSGMSYQHLSMSHERFHKIIIPNDLGTTTMFEFLVPVVTKTDINMKQDSNDNKLKNLNIEASMSTMIHYRHGLSFYNPMADMWQGINRYHAFDLVMPINMEISLNMQQQSLQLSWKKHSNPAKNIAGIRSHVKQLVFVRDDRDTKVLQMSSPEAKNWVAVEEVDPNHNTFTLMDDDDLNTGTRWMMKVYDTNLHITNGSFNHLMQEFMRPWNMNYDNILTRLMLTEKHMMRHMFLLPKAGMHGLLIRAEPSRDHDVSSIDLSMRVSMPEMTGEELMTSPRKMNARLTYAVKNKEQSLKTWDMTANMELNLGHTINSFKMFMTRIIPGQKDYKICMDGVKKYTNKGVSGHLNVAMSQSPDGKCAKDSTVIDITMTGERSQQQLMAKNMKYHECSYPVPYLVTRFYTLDCLAAKTSIRKYMYDVKTTNMPTEFKMFFMRMWDTMRSYFMSYYTFDDEHMEEVGENSLKLKVFYPMQADEVDITLMTPKHIHKLSSIPMRSLSMMGMEPDNMMYPSMFRMMQSMGGIERCMVRDNMVSFNDRMMKMEMPNDWTMFWALNLNGTLNQNMAVFMKKMGDNVMGLKVVNGKNNMEAVMKGDMVQVTVDGTAMDAHDKIHLHDWINYQMVEHDGIMGIVMYLRDMDVHIGFNGRMALITMMEDAVMVKADGEDPRKCLAPMKMMM